MTGRRFLWRWSARVLRRQWRQHLVVTALITAAAALSVGAVVSAFNLAAPPEHRYGTGQVRATLLGDTTGAVESLELQGHRFGGIGSITIDSEGSSQRVEVRSQDPANPVVAPLIALLDGRWPTGPGEIAVTNDVPLPSLDPSTAVGASIELAGVPNRIVGLVENPTDLTDEFVLASGLDGLGVDLAKQATTFLVEGPPSEVTFPAGSGQITVEGREGPLDDRTQIAIAVNLVSAVAMFEVALLVGAGFAVLARRRARQFGLLAAAGATPGQIRQAAGATGVVVGFVGATIGAAIGVLTAATVVPRMEATVGHRIDLAVPWWSVGPTLALAVAIAGLAAWWPARALSTEPVVNALAALRPTPSSTRGSTTLGLGCLAVGGSALAVGAAQLLASLMVGGIVVCLIGLLLLGPALVRLIGRWSTALPLPARLAGRAVARQQGRSAAVVAALTLALGIPVGLAVVTASIDGHNRTKATNLDERTALAWLPGAEQSEQLIPIDLDADDGAIAAAIDRVDAVTRQAADAAAVPIQVAVSPEAEPSQFTFDRLGPTLAIDPVFGIRPADENCLDLCDENTLGDRDENGDEILVTFHDVWVATPELLEALGVEPSPSSESAQALSRHDDAALSTHRDQSPEFRSNVAVAAELPPETSLAPTLVWPEMVADNGWDTVTVGWLFTADEPLEAELMEAMTAAAGTELLVEFIAMPTPSSGVRAVGIAAGIVISLGIVAAAVGLLISESADDLRTLRSIGAGPRTTRWLSASTAAILAAAGAVIAIPTGYLALVVLMANPRGHYGAVVPLASLASILFLVPALAAALGWLAVGRTGASRVAGRRPVVAMLALALAGAACSPGQPEISAEPFADTVGCDRSMDAALEAWADRGVGASIALFSDERTCVGAYGLADVSTGRDNTVDTVFSIGSITKAVTGAAIFDLIDAGRLTLDDPAGSHVDGLGDRIGALTIRDLLLHTSGLVGEHGIDHRPLSATAATKSIGGLDLAFDAGTAYSYANANYTLLALVIEAVTDEGYRRYLVDHILLDRTGIAIGGFWDGEPGAGGPRAFGYQFDGTVSAQRGDFPGPHWALDGNGGVAMTAVEMAEWTWSLFNGHILSPQATELFLSTTTVLGGETELAGWARLSARDFGEVIYTTSGGGGSIGHLMTAAWLPESDRVIAIAENAADYDVPFFSGDITPAILAGTGIPTPPIVPEADPAELERAVGSYRVGDGGMVSVSERDGGLLIGPVGIEAVEAVLPVPVSADPLIDLHEDHARAFVDGETPEGRRFRERIEDERGPLRSAEVIGTAFEGELGTYVELTFDEGPGLLVVGFNTAGGTEYWSTDVWPVLWYVASPDGAFEMWPRQQNQPSIRLVPTADGLRIEQDGRSLLAPPVG